MRYFRDTAGNVLSLSDDGVLAPLEEITLAHESVPGSVNLVRTTSTGRRVQSCSICGEQGHTVITCPKGAGKHPKNVFNKDHAPTVRKCSKCNKPGHRSDKCPTDPPKNRQLELEPSSTGKLTREQFDAVIGGVRTEGMTSKDVAKEMHLPISEVNRACESGTYDRYCKAYDTRN